MVTRPEYTANVNVLKSIADSYRDTLLVELVETKTLDEARVVAKGTAAEYYDEFRTQLDKALREAGTTAAKSYRTTLELSISNADLNNIVDSEVRRLYKEKYYGLNLFQRLNYNYIRLSQNVTRSSNVGKGFDTRKRNIARIFTDSYPFGSQVALDARVMLSEGIRLEHNIARRLAEQKNVDLVKWTVSEHHFHKDICDHLAVSIQKDVKQYLAKNKLQLRPEGLYLLANCPYPPHPNCQCTLSFVLEKTVQKTTVERTIDSILHIVDRILGRKPKK